MKLLRQLYNLIRPICPHCQGSGGFNNYWGDDWDGCSCCNPEENREEAVIRIWFWQWWRFRYERRQEGQWTDRQIAEEERRAMENEK
jgi:hypothetical protein